METRVFDRIEKKYIINKTQKKQLLCAIRKNMKKDNYHKSEVYNIYFDNDNFETIINSIDWVDFKAKIRARNYQGYDRVFLEVKTKVYDPEENIGYKRRVMITLKDFELLTSNKKTLEEIILRNEPSPRNIQIAKEIDYLISRLELSPKIIVIYNRESYKDGDNLRITFDENLRYRDINLSFISKKDDTMYFKDNKNIIMEVKAHGVIPLWLANTMAEVKAYPERFSKIGNIYQKIKKKGQDV